MKYLLLLITFVAFVMALPATLVPEMSLHARNGDPSYWDDMDISEDLKKNYREHEDQDQDNVDQAMLFLANKKHRGPGNYEDAMNKFADLTTNNDFTRNILLWQLRRHTKSPQDLFEELLGNSVRSRKSG